MSTRKPDAAHGDDVETSEMAEERGTNAEGTEVLGDSPEDVLVLLPEGSDIPIVETEAVEEPSDLEGGAPTIPIEDVALRDLNPLAEEMPVYGEPEEAPPTENLEELASEMDDEFLAPEPAAPAPRRARARDVPAPRFLPSEEPAVERPRRRKLPLAVAALLALAATGYLTFPRWKQYVEPYLPGAAAHSTAGVKKAPVPAPVEMPVPAGTKAQPAGGGAAGTVDVVRASREAFREKFLLSIELGYVGEVADE